MAGRLESCEAKPDEALVLLVPGPGSSRTVGVGVVPNNVKPLLVQDQHTNCPIKASEH